MGDLIQFPGERCSRGRKPFPADATPVEVLTEFLAMAKRGEICFLAVAVYANDGSYTHVELGLVTPEEDPPTVPA